MKWVKCINTSMLVSGQTTRPLTTGKIYAVKQTRKLSTINEILIKGDDDEERWFHFERFEDVTAQRREQLINKILNE